MKSIKDQISLVRKTISFILLVTFSFSNALVVAASTGDERLTVYTTDLTHLGREGRLRQTPNFETEINRVLEVLEKGGARQPVIVDENGSVQDEMVEQIALRIAKGSVGESLRARSLVKLETAKLVSNGKSAAEISDYLDEVLKAAAAANGATILFVEDLSYVVNAVNSRPAVVKLLSEGKLSLIGSSSMADFNTPNRSRQGTCRPV